MAKKKFLNRRSGKERHSGKLVSTVTTATLYAGIILLVSALSYLIANFAEADFIVGIWLPFVIAGIVLALMSQAIKWIYKHGSHK